MPFQMRDVTGGFNVFYIDNSGNLGLGSLPNSGAQVTVSGTTLFNTNATLGAATVPPGAQINSNGSVSLPANGTVTVSYSFNNSPSVTSSVIASQVSSSSTTFTDSTGAASTVPYAIW